MESSERRDETVLFACIQRGTMWRGGKTGPGILLALRSEYETKRKGKKKKKKAEEEKRRRRA